MKTHALLDLRGSIPTFILDDIIPEAGAFYVMDRGYLDRARLHTIHSGGAFSVIRTKTGLGLTLVTQTAADLGIPIYPAQLVPRMTRGEQRFHCCS